MLVKHSQDMHPVLFLLQYRDYLKRHTEGCSHTAGTLAQTALWGYCMGTYYLTLDTHELTDMGCKSSNARDVPPFPHMPLHGISEPSSSVNAGRKLQGYHGEQYRGKLRTLLPELNTDYRY